LKAEGDRLRINAPKGVLSDHLRGQLAERKQALLEFLRINQPQETFIPPAIVRHAAEGTAALSFAQERLWFLEQLQPGSTVYNICRASRLTGNLNMAALEASLNEILRRHEVLRSVIRIVDSRPVQVAANEFQVKLFIFDLQNFAGGEREAEVQRRIQEEALRPFDFSAGFFVRAVLLRVAANHHVLILTTHHMMSDAWSMGILTRELWTLYEAFVSDKVPPLNDLPIQYSDFAAWQREWLQGDALESQLAYWKKQLAEIPILNLPTDRPRPARQSFRGARVPISLTESLTAAVNDLSYRFNVTPFMTLFAAFQVLLCRYSGQEDIVVGTPVGNRSRSELETLIGFFVNTLVLRADLSGTPSFRELLSRLRDVCLGAYAHQDLPFEKLVQELQPERDLSRNPLFQVMFALQNAHRNVPAVSGLSFERMEIDTRTSQFDLALFLREREGKLIGFLEYNTDLFDHSTIERMAGHFQILLGAIVADPDQSISTLPLLTEEEKHQLLVEWNDTAADCPRDSSCIHELFEAQVERTPDAVALEFEGKSLTYRELNARANQLAHYLRGLGIGPEDLVGICVERSLEMVVGLLGILKAGGAYVPLDPVYPRGRLEFMLNDAQIAVLVTQKPLLRHLPRTGAVAVCLDDLTVFDQENKENPKNEAKAKSAAYVIFTSGSTGTPKGVVGLHTGAVNRFAWMWDTYPFGPNEMSCIKTSLSFVDSVWEVFGPLLNGIPSTIISDQVIKDPQLLIQTLADNHVTRIVLVPSLLKAILDVNPNLQSRLPDLKLWTSSGEPLSRQIAERFRQCLPNSKLLNLYGSSEVSADATCYQTRKTGSSGSISIGRPIHNTQIYLLDSHLQLVPIGISGEICVGGMGLARGYLNRPELTAERFIPNFFSREPRSRLYRTGDLARFLSNGNIEFLGRVDNQVKIRGYRIEPAEVEVVLNQHPAVCESVVVACDDAEPRGVSSDPSKRLVAYIIASVQKPSVSELRNFLMKRLPGYMVPAVFIALDHLPVTPNGKVNRQALPPPDAAKSTPDHSFVEPRTEIEVMVAKVWRDVLKIEWLGIHDNFFELGGHSLLGSQVVARLRDAFCRQIPLRALFEAPTVAQFALKIERIIQGRRSRELPPLVPVSRNGCLPASQAQEQFWIVDELLPGTELLNMAYAYRIIGPLDATVLHKSLQEVVNRHEALRTVFTEIDGRLVQVVDKKPRIQLHVTDLSHLPASKRDKQATKLSRRDARAAFDLEKAPLVRAKLIRLTENEHILLVTMHHIIADQWSMGVFRNDLAALYDAFSCGRPSPLPELRIQFADFVWWQQEVLRRGLLKTQIVYWQKRLAGILPMLEFEKDRRKKRSVGFRTSRRLFEFDPTFFADINALARQESSTPFMIILTALNIVLHRFTGQRDIRIGTLAANRSLKETEKLIGYFVNTVIICTRVPPRWTFRRLLKRVQKNALEAFAHQDVPIEELDSALEKKRKTIRQPLFQVLFNYRNLAFQSRNDSGLIFAPWDGKNRLPHPGITMTTLDLIIELRETSTKLTGAVTYKTEIFSEQLIAQIIDSFHIILARVNLQSDCRVSNIFDRSYGERKQS
jgi:amino acid adenylation domain-containing protein